MREDILFTYLLAAASGSLELGIEDIVERAPQVSGAAQ
jgi:hypothetical protein